MSPYPCFVWSFEMGMGRTSIPLTFPITLRMALFTQLAVLYQFASGRFISIHYPQHHKFLLSNLQSSTWLNAFWKSKYVTSISFSPSTQANVYSNYRHISQTWFPIHEAISIARSDYDFPNILLSAMNSKMFLTIDIRLTAYDCPLFIFHTFWISASQYLSKI